MSRILFLYERNMPTVSIMREIYGKKNFEYEMVFTFKSIKAVRAEDIDKADVLIFIRPDNLLSSRIAKYAKNAGCFVVTMCDDDLLHLPIELPSIPWRKYGLIKTLEVSDVIMSSSKYICEKYRKYTFLNRIAVTNTSVSADEIREMFLNHNTQEKDDLVKIVYAANPGHITLFNQYILPIMSELTDRYAGKISMTFVGVRPDLEKYEKKIVIQYQTGMPLKEYREYMKREAFDIGLAPLNIDEFSKCKYFNKYLEYTLSGIVGVYTDTEPYTFAVKHRKNGYLTANNKESWLKTLTEVIEDSEKRKSCIENAKNDLKNNFTEKRVMEELVKNIPELQTYHAKRKKCKNFSMEKVGYCIVRWFDWLYLSLFYWKHGGTKRLIDKIKIHFRESSAYK